METHLKHLDLFSGVGMFGLAARWAGIETVAFSEVDPYANDVLTHRFPETRNLGDIRKLCKRTYEYRAIDAEEEMFWCDLCDEEWGLCQCIGADEFTDTWGSPDIISAGVPCQGFSLNGKGEGLDHHESGLWYETLRILRELRPYFLIVENVPAIKSRGAETILDGLGEEGYRAEAFVVGADAVGGKHRRKRVFIVAYDKSVGMEGVRPEREQLTQSLAPEILPLSRGHGQWEVEPDLRRAPHGDARWMDRLKCIGNSIVPQIPVHFFDFMREVLQAQRLAA